jgi:predicted amidophosphoribosyltransferase
MSDPSVQISDAVKAGGSLRPLKSFFGKTANKLADFILPLLCLVCRSSVLGHGGLCSKCWPDIDFIEPPRCDVLGIPLPYPSDETVVSAVALAYLPDYDRARVVARYDGVMRELIHGLKYGDRHEGLKLFCRWMVHAGADVLEGADLLVPVPLARTRLWSRRFNQSALLACALAHAGNLADNPFALERTRRTASQVGLSTEQRKKTWQAPFVCRISNDHVLQIVIFCS